MLTKRNLSHINNLKDIKSAKLSALADIEVAENRLETLFSDLPMKALGNTVGFVAAAVAKGFQGKDISDNAEGYGQSISEPMSFSKTLQAVGQETALYGIAKLIEKLVANR